ncbi:hypothetical protein [Pseudobacteriovorax antillogorgiicola]|uniref:Lipoprotein n=1 Tax=Pseudobacteriovorax antillogorgiicola TaxID=1513793 RepID=A0A1Y6BML7_9BACT|nr:hypothetical protein [Pseudobacteriovorax antillogorgiicola]TCS54561.1 hypothetical protein EDD56_10674 [Pseudobacteriovorax antillogorgiicola]SMF18261.1 hypothetical protein SAMN06296036_106169 [Pseudobacteriovorax antillogorgiicola]
MKYLLLVGLMSILVSCKKEEEFSANNRNLTPESQVTPPQETNTPASESEPFEQFELQFEDWVDFDFDIYFCAKGNYRLKTDDAGYTRIESLKDQTIEMNSGSLNEFGCANKLLIKHIRNGSLIQEQTLDLISEDGSKDLSFEVQVGDLIDPVFLIGAGAFCDKDQTTGLQVTISDRERSRIYYNQDQCQTKVCKCPFF